MLTVISSVIVWGDTLTTVSARNYMHSYRGTADWNTLVPLSGSTSPYYTQIEQSLNTSLAQLSISSSFQANRKYILDMKISVPKSSIIFTAQGLGTDGYFHDIVLNDTGIVKNWGQFNSGTYNFSTYFTPNINLRGLRVRIEYYNSTGFQHEFRYYDFEMTEQTNTVQDIKDGLEDTNEILEEQVEIQKGIWQTIKDIFAFIINLPSMIVNLLLDGLKSLFVPSDDYFESLLDDLNIYFSDRFGFLYAPIEYMIKFFDLIVSPDMDYYAPYINFPGITLSADTFHLDEDFELLPQMEVQIIPDGFEYIQIVLHAISTVLLSLYIINLAQTKYKEVFG
jgi:hypothetical protein